ncbi:hypothetical protein GCM10010383_72540 [Streptomyces lomondensis]|uniref:Uncharacterized protein n=1 Tax=Streptomyces lomondensis TaxID=68229 RepID=A0ABQ2XS88_9ACTN|nr:hypothetical protein GCM10010383_72540 [Streptomyces lomondensis]
MRLAGRPLAATFRPGDAPPLRGTLAVLGERELALYATGSIEFYRTYPACTSRARSASDPSFPPGTHANWQPKFSL